MEQITITLAWGAALHTFTLPAEVAAAWMSAQGINLADSESALKEASVRIVDPVVSQGLALLHEQEKAGIIAAVRGGQP